MCLLIYSFAETRLHVPSVLLKASCYSYIYRQATTSRPRTSSIDKTPPLEKPRPGFSGPSFSYPPLPSISAPIVVRPAPVRTLTTFWIDTVCGQLGPRCLYPIAHWACQRTTSGFRRLTDPSWTAAYSHTIHWSIGRTLVPILLAIDSYHITMPM